MSLMTLPAAGNGQQVLTGTADPPGPCCAALDLPRASGSAKTSASTIVRAEAMQERPKISAPTLLRHQGCPGRLAGGVPA